MTTKSSQTNQEMLLTEKSHMLDEVNSLLDLMLNEKHCLHKKISDLELQLLSTTPKQQLNTRHNGANGNEETTREKVTQTDIVNDEPMMSSVAHIRETVMREREELRHMGLRIEDVTQYCDKERSSLRAEVDKTRGLLERSETNSRRQIREMKMLEGKLSEALKSQSDLKDSNSKLTQSLEDMRIKYMKSRTSLLAMKGRKLMETKKANKAGESKHIKELTNVLQKEQEGKNRLQQLLQRKEREIDNLSMLLTKKDNELFDMSKKYDVLRHEVEEKLSNLGQELSLSRDEISRVAKMMKTKQEQLDQSRHLLQQERLKSAENQSKTCSVVTQLTAQLDTERINFEQQIHELNLKISKLKARHVIEMDRMKDVTSQRCKELVHELWMLKNK